MVTALVPSDTACLASSPGRRSLTEVWISLDVSVFFSAVPRERDRFCGEAVKRVLDERVHDAHRTAGDARLGVHLLEHLVDVAREGLDTPLAALVATRLLGGRLGGGFAGSFGHFDIFVVCLVS